MIILNKTDLLLDHETDKLAGELKEQIRKGTKLVPAQHGALDATALLGIASAAENDMHNRLSHHEMEGEVQHDHDDFVTFSVPLGVIPDRQQLLARIEDVIAAHDILRLKGFAAIEGAPGRLLIQAVGPRLNSYFDRPWGADEKRMSEIVVIGLKGLDRAQIEARLRG
jgi:cobalamin biosynthesis protein CobW